MAMTKEQRRAYDKAWRDKNKGRYSEKRNAAAKVYYQKNKEKIIKKVTERRKQNPEPSRASCRKYYHKNRDAFLFRVGLGIKLSEVLVLLGKRPRFRVPASHFGISNF